MSTHHAGGSPARDQTLPAARVWEGAPTRVEEAYFRPTGRHTDPRQKPLPAESPRAALERAARAKARKDTAETAALIALTALLVLFALCAAVLAWRLSGGNPPLAGR